MKTPNINKWLAKENTVRGFWNSANAWVCTGARLGSRDDAEDLSEPLYLQRLTPVDGDYSRDGTYWGDAGDMWCAFNPKTAVRIYVRAKSREAAVSAVRMRRQSVQFFRRHYVRAKKQKGR